MRLSYVVLALAELFISPVVSTDACLSDKDASVVAHNFAQLISNYSKPLGDQFLSTDFKDQSDSVSTLINNGTNMPIPLGSLTFPSKTAYQEAQSGQPNIPFEILNTWHTCREVIIRWVSKMSPQQVQGFTAMAIQLNPNRQAPAQFKYQIRLAYGEFNSGAWLADLGRPECQAT